MFDLFETLNTGFAMTPLKKNRQLLNIQGEILSTSMYGTEKHVKHANSELFY